MLRRCPALLVVIGGCSSPLTFDNELVSHTTNPSFRLHTAVHQRVDTEGQPSTKFEVWVSRSAEPRGTPPPEETIVRTADVRVGGDSLVQAPFADDRYVANLEGWISDIHVTATDAGDEATIEHAEMLSNPDEMNVEFPTVVPAGIAQNMTWSPQGKPITPMFTVATIAEPVQFTLLPALGGAFEDGVKRFASSVFPVPGMYSLNFVRRVDYVDPDEYEPPITLAGITYWHTKVTAIPPPQR